MVFSDRAEAGRALAERLMGQALGEGVVYGLPRGGVIVAAEIAKALGWPLEVLVARKIGHPASPEYGVGAVTARGHLVANEREKASLGAEWFARAAERESAIAQEQLCRYAGSAKQAELAGKTAVVVDDGIATGYTLRAAVLDIRERNPSRIIVAVPVAPSGVQQHLAFDVDEWVILHQPEFGFGAVGTYYEDFRPVTDEAVLAALDACGQ